MKKNFSLGFTLIEVAVVIVIMLILATVIMFGATQYINKGKDSNIAANLSILIPAGEVFYRGNGESYSEPGGASFCDPSTSVIFRNAIAQMPQNLEGSCYESSNLAGVCCKATDNAWVACAKQFTDSTKAFCVDSRGVKKEISSSQCSANISPLKCPD